MRAALVAAFLLMGLTLTATQGLVVRAILVACGGNELTIGVILGNWLLSTAIGSALAGRLATRSRFDVAAFAALQTILASLLPVTIVAGVMAHTFTGALPGEGVGLGPALGVSFLLLVPVSLVGGTMFAVGCAVGARLSPPKKVSAGAVYALESLGGVIGGVVLTYVFIPLSQPVRVAFILSALNLLAAGALLALSAVRSRPYSRTLLAALCSVLLLVALAGLVTPLADTLLGWAVAQQWVGHEVVAYEDSAYGNVAVIRRDTEYTFFVDGLPLFTTPNPDTARIEELVHLPLLFGPAPRHVLVLSGGMGGVLREVLKYPVESVDYAELDPLLIAEVQRFPTSLTTAELNDARVTVHTVDGRLLVREQAAQGHPRYDLVLVNLPYPATLQVNRFFTAEFYRTIRSLLTDQGILVVPLPGGLTYLGPELTGLHNLVHQALGQAFAHVRPIPGDTTLWLASPSPAVLSDDVAALVARWQASGPEARLITAPYLRDRFDPARAAWFQETLARGRAVTPNEDLRPTGVYYGLTYWNALFSPDLVAPFEALARLSLPLLLVLLLGAFGFIWMVSGVARRCRRATVPLAIGTTGLAGMVASVVSLLACQTLLGHVYQQIGLLTAASMAGLAVGAGAMNAALRRWRADRHWLVALEAVILGFWVLCPAVLMGLVQVEVMGLVLPTLLVVNVGAGLLVGAEFPLVNALVQTPGAGSGPAGLLYAADLVGAFAGAILVGVVLVPVLGIVETCLLVAALKGGSLLLVVTRSRG